MKNNFSKQNVMNTDWLNSSILIVFIISLLLSFSCSYRQISLDPATDNKIILTHQNYPALPAHIQSSANLKTKIMVIENAKKYEKLSLQISDSQGKDWGEFIWYKLKNNAKDKKLEIIWPILVGRQMYVARVLATKVFLPLGIDSIIIRPQVTPFEKDKPKNPEELNQFHRRTLQRLRVLRLWISGQLLYQKAPLGITGTSYGAILTAMSLPQIDSQFVSIKLIMGGGNIPRILLESKEFKVKTWRDAIIHKYSTSYKITHTQARQRLEKEFINNPMDPLRFAAYGKKFTQQKKIAMVISLYDDKVPTDCQKKLWQSYAQPEVLFVRTGHYTMILAYFPLVLFMKKTTARHFNIQNR